LSARVGFETARKLLILPAIEHVDTKRQSSLLLTKVLTSIGIVSAQKRERQLAEDGTGVLIGIVDSGFDLSHPAFRNNGRLRVEALLDQKDRADFGVEYDTEKLESSWRNGTGPGADEHGHGTHVASIAGGTVHQGFEGVAPAARFLLVRGNMMDNEDAIAWIERRANGRPCVINLSYGNHYGAHDGSDHEERYHADHFAGPGKIIVAAAGNERERRLHIGKNFTPGADVKAKFDILESGSRFLKVIVTAWYDSADLFSAQLISPTGKTYSVPYRNQDAVAFEEWNEIVELYHRDYEWNNLVQIQVAIQLDSETMPESGLEGWTLRFRYEHGKTGRLDAWFHQEGVARFTGMPGLLEEARTVGLPATGKACIAVGSYVSRNDWESDDGRQIDNGVLIGSPSPFSSLGPARDGTPKPDISSPGQYVTAALAARCELSKWERRKQEDERLLTLEGTSMSSPVVAGTVALMLQRKRTLTPLDIREILQRTAVRDDTFNGAGWNEALGYGRLDALKAVMAVI
jgi:subtilisin family serine protease